MTYVVLRTMHINFFYLTTEKICDFLIHEASYMQKTIRISIERFIKKNLNFISKLYINI